jgi:hypothetical protein
MNHVDLVAHGQLAPLLLATYGDPGPGVLATYRMAASGKLPVVFKGSRIFVERKRLPEIAEILGIDASAKSKVAA